MQPYCLELGFALGFTKNKEIWSRDRNCFSERTVNFLAQRLVFTLSDCFKRWVYFCLMRPYDINMPMQNTNSNNGT